MSLVTVPSALAPLPGEATANPPSFQNRAYCVSLTPAAAPVGRGARPIAAGVFPVWLVQTDASGIERCRVLVSSPAALYFGEGTGARWFLLAPSSTPAGNDTAWDVTMGDHPGDWLDSTVPPVAASPVAAAGPPVYDEALVFEAAAGASVASAAPGWTTVLTTPEWARTMLLFGAHQGTTPAGGATSIGITVTARDKAAGLYGFSDDFAESNTTGSAAFYVNAGAPVYWQHLFGWNLPSPQAASGSVSLLAASFGPLPRSLRVRVGGQGGPGPLVYSAGQRSAIYVRWGA